MTGSKGVYGKWDLLCEKQYTQQLFCNDMIFFFFEMLLHINIHNPKGQSLLIHPSNWTETELGAFKSFQVNALDKVTNGDRCPRDIKEVSLVGGCQWTVVTDDRL